MLIISILDKDHLNTRYNLLKYPIEGLDNRPLGVTQQEKVDIEGLIRILIIMSFEVNE